MLVSNFEKPRIRPPVFIPSFLAIDPARQSGDLAENVAASQDDVQQQGQRKAAIASSPVVADAGLTFKPMDDGRVAFVLRSRMNAKVLTGHLAGAFDDDTEAASRLLDRCSRESSFRLERAPAGLVWSLLDESGACIGNSGVLADAALARATLRLITGQAARALRSFGAFV